MKKSYAILFGILLSFTSLISSAEAYYGVYTNEYYGEHPYERRTRELNARREHMEYLQKHSRYIYDNPVYTHPIYANNAALHPFYRKGGTSHFQNVRSTLNYASWRGYQDPIRAHALSPDTYCTNFSYQRMQYRGQALGYRCF